MRTTNYLLIVWLFLVALGVLLLWYAKSANDAEDPRAQAPAPVQEEKKPAPPGNEAPPLPAPPEPAPPADGTVKARPRIVDDAGAPVPGAVVAFVKSTKEERVTVFGVPVRRTIEIPAWRVTADKDGSFDWPADVAPGTYTLTVRAPELAPFLKEIRHPSADTELERVRLTRGGAISVTTGLKERGVPLVLASSKGEVAVREIDANGETRFSGLAPDNYAVLLGDPDMPFTMRSGDLPPQEPYAFQHEVTPTTAELSADLAVAIKDLAQVSGRVKGCADGEITIRAKGQAPCVRTHAVGADGAFSFQYLPAGEYELVLVPSLGKSFAKTVTLGAGDKLTIDEIDFPLGEICGAVVRSDGRTPLPDVTVALAPVDGAGELAAVTDPDGKFRFTRLAPGQYRLTAARAGAEPVAAHAFASTTGTPAEITITYP